MSRASFVPRRWRFRWRSAIAACLAAASVATPAFAWNNHAHMVVAAVAWQELTPRTRQRVGVLLAKHPDYAAWTAGVADDDRTRVAFLKAATWPDRIRGDPAYTRDERPGAKGLGGARNPGYADRQSHPSWHFRDAPIVIGGAAAVEPQSPNAGTQIHAFRRELRGRAPDAVKSYDLVWLEHLVADVHQPLHAVSRYTPVDPDGDRGGNDVKLCAEPCRDTLHTLWDRALGQVDGVGAATAAAAALPQAPDELARLADERIWLQESETIARNSVYAPPIGPGLGPYPVSEADRGRVREIARGRVALAGRRLAALLNQNLR